MQNKYLFNYKRLHLPGGEPMNKMAVYTSCFVPLSPIFVWFSQRPQTRNSVSNEGHTDTLFRSQLRCFCYVCHRKCLDLIPEQRQPESRRLNRPTPWGAPRSRRCDCTPSDSDCCSSSSRLAARNERFASERKHVVAVGLRTNGAIRGTVN